jgi:hypothetical protein
MPPVISVLVNKEQFSVPNPLRLPRHHHYAYVLQAIARPIPELPNALHSATIRFDLGSQLVVELVPRDPTNLLLLSLISKANLPTIVQGILGPLPGKLPVSVAQSVVQLVCPTAILAPTFSGKSAFFFVPTDDLPKLISLKQLEPGLPLSFRVREPSEQFVQLQNSPISTPALSPVTTTVPVGTKNHSNLIQELSVVPGLNSTPISDKSIVLSDPSRDVANPEVKRDTSLPLINTTQVSAPESVQNSQQAARSVTPVLSRISAVTTAPAPVQDEDSPIPSLIVVTSSQLAVKTPLLRDVKPAKRRNRQNRQPRPNITPTRTFRTSYRTTNSEKPFLHGEETLKIWFTLFHYVDGQLQDHLIKLLPELPIFDVHFEPHRHLKDLKPQYRYRYVHSPF